MREESICPLVPSLRVESKSLVGDLSITNLFHHCIGM